MSSRWYWSLYPCAAERLPRLPYSAPYFPGGATHRLHLSTACFILSLRSSANFGVAYLLTALLRRHQMAIENLNSVEEERALRREAEERAKHRQVELSGMFINAQEIERSRWRLKSMTILASVWHSWRSNWKMQKKQSAVRRMKLSGRCIMS